MFPGAEERMSSPASLFDHEYQYLLAAEVELESYLLSSELYYPTGIRASISGENYPPLTLGNIELSQQKARALASDQGQELLLERISNRVEQLRVKWRVAWEAKATREFRARLNLWSDFLDEYRDHPAGNYDRYAYEVNRRVILELLSDQAVEISEDEFKALDRLDQYLRMVLARGGFTWDEGLESGFPVDRFWYLYGDLRP